MFVSFPFVLGSLFLPKPQPDYLEWIGASFVPFMFVLKVPIPLIHAIPLEYLTSYSQLTQSGSRDKYFGFINQSFKVEEVSILWYLT